MPFGAPSFAVNKDKRTTLTPFGFKANVKTTYGEHEEYTNYCTEKIPWQKRSQSVSSPRGQDATAQAATLSFRGRNPSSSPSRGGPGHKPKVNSPYDFGLDFNHDAKIIAPTRLKLPPRQPRIVPTYTPPVQNGAPPAPAPTIRSQSAGQRTRKISTEQKHREAMTAFKQFDKDGNGYISHQEAHVILDSILGFTPEQTEALVLQHDSNKDGRLSYDEFLIFYGKVKARKLMIDKSFREYDQTMKGTVTKKDAIRQLETMNFNDRDVDAIFSVHDDNFNGVLDFDEFAKFWNENKEVVVGASQSRGRSVRK